MSVNLSFEDQSNSLNFCIFSHFFEGFILSGAFLVTTHLVGSFSGPNLSERCFLNPQRSIYFTLNVFFKGTLLFYITGSLVVARETFDKLMFSDYSCLY